MEKTFKLSRKHLQSILDTLPADIRPDDCHCFTVKFVRNAEKLTDYYDHKMVELTFEYDQLTKDWALPITIH